MSVRMLCRPPASGLSSHPASSSSSSSSSSSTAIGSPLASSSPVVVVVSSSSTSVSVPSSSSSPPSSPPSSSFPVPVSSPPHPPPPPVQSSFSGPSASGSVSGPAPNPNPNVSSPLNHAPSNAVPPPVPAPASGAGSNGIVVVGAISRSEDDVSVLLDRLLDAQVFTARRSSDHGLGRKEQQQRHGGGGGGSVKLGNGNLKDTGKPDFGGASNPNLQPYQNGSSHSNEDEVVSQGESQGQEDEIGLRHGKVRSRRGKEGSGSGQNTSGASVRYLQKNPGKEGRIKEIEKGGREWIDHKLKHYYDEEHGVMYLQFVWGSQPLDFLNENLEAARGEGIAAALERHEAESLRGLLFMFSVCHIVLMVQEGSRFDPRFLRMFRTLQAAKHALAPFVKTQVLPGLLPAPANKPTLPPRPVSSMASNTSGRNSGGTGRQSSTIALMSGSAPVLFPGQCTPVTLFVFLEDSPDSTATMGGFITAARSDEATESTGVPSGSQTGSVHILRQELQSKPSNSISGSARPGSKPEPGFRKKMQSSTEAQIRFLLKKCRTIASVAGEGGSLGAPVGTGMGPRGLREVVGSIQGAGAGGALFSLDPSRAVVLLERSANRRSEALDAVTGMLEEVLEGRKGSADTFTDLVGTSVGGEDLSAIKDFLWRHMEILRGRGGISSGSAGNSAGVGMVAAAAAAAAASAASGASGGGNGTKKPLHNPPELPTISGWFTACQILVDGLSAAWEATAAEDERVDMDMKPEKGVLVRGPEGSPRIVLRKGTVSSPEKNKRNSTGGTLTPAPMSRNRGTTLEEAMANLVSCTDMDLKFSMAWCKRVLPSAHEVYSKGLPPCYPTSTHEAHLERALHSFQAMVRGPAVPLFAEKLQADCEAVWHAGRQLCDAESLTGKPCIHQVHEVVNFGGGPEFGRKSAKVGSVTKGGIQEKVARGKDRRISKPHSSGVVFLHACACGRSRRHRKDPFDYESANVSFFQFPNCEDLLPSLAMPSGDGGNSLGGSAWSLVHLGNAQYYQPVVGLTQSGFCTKQNFLSPCKFVVLYHKESTPDSLQTKEDAGPGTEDVATETDLLGSKAKLLLPRPLTAALESKPAGYSQQSLYSKVAETGAITEMRGLAKAPSVASERRAMTTTFFKASYGGDAAFPPLPQKNERLSAVTPAKSAKQTSGKERKNIPASQPMQGENHLPVKLDTLNVTAEKHPESVNIMQNGRENAEESTGCDAVAVGGIRSTKTEEFCAYVGFEHECPHGHRFLLSVDHLQSLGPFSVQLPSNVQHSVRESPDVLPKQTKQDHRAGPSKEHSTASGGQDASAGSYGETLDSTTRVERKAAEGLTVMSVSEGSGDGHTLLGLNLPIYMNCPYCRDSESKQDGVVFAGCVSQLQRIFLVTPPFPLVLASRAVVEFEAKAGMEFHSGSEVILPPDSFLSLRLPFIYYTEGQNGVRTPLFCNKENPERTAWLHKCSTLYVISGGGDAPVPVG